MASAAGLVVRSGNGLVVLDLDGDGHEQTGWVLLYLHVSSDDRIPVGTWVDEGTHLGHPSCEGGLATGTHVHFARKYNGEWIAADGPMPFVLNGWRAHAGEAAYKGTLTRGEEVVDRLHLRLVRDAYNAPRRGSLISSVVTANANPQDWPTPRVGPRIYAHVLMTCF